MNQFATNWFTSGWREEQWLNQWELPFGKWVEESINWLNVKGEFVFDIIKWPFENLLDLVTYDILLNIPWPFMMLLLVVLGILIRDIKIGFGAAAGIFLCGILGTDYWLLTMQTIGVILVAVIICVAIGLPYGVLCARSDRLWNLTRPALDGMQLVHAFTYLIAIIFFFGTGPVGGTIATMIFAIPPMIRLTNLGIRQVPDDVVEAAKAYGASDYRVLMDVQLPLARPAIMTGLNQVLLLSLSFVGIIAVISGGGLGQEVYRGIRSSNPAVGAASGLALYLVGVVMDRLSQPQPKDNRSLVRRMGAALRREYEIPPMPTTPTGERQDPGIQVREAADRLKEDAALILLSPSKEHPMVHWIGLIGGIVAASSMFLVWTNGSGLVSGYARPSDREIEGSFTGFDASGGSWFGILVFLVGILVICGSLSGIVRGRVPLTRWLGVPLTVACLGTAIVGMMTMYVLIEPYDLAGSTERSTGVYLALISGIILLAGGVLANITSPPRTSVLKLSPGLMLLTLFAIGLLVVGAFSNWVSDTRPDAFTPEELQLIEEERANPTDGGTVRLNQILSDDDPVRFNGFDASGPNLSWGMLLAAIAMGVCAFMAFIVSRLAEMFDALLLGVSAAVILTIGAWTVSFLRVADDGIFTGPAALPCLVGGALGAVVALSRMRLRHLEERETVDLSTVG